MRILRSLFLLATLSAILASACARSTPDLVLAQGEQDLGGVVNGEIRTLEVQVGNEGDGVLIIQAVSTSCGCTSAEVDPSRISPGQSGVLRVRFDSGAHGPEANGPVMRQVFIASNDPDQPEAEFRIRAEVLPPQ